MALRIPARYELKKLGPVGGQASLCHARDKWLDRAVVMKAALDGANYEVAAEVRSLAAINSKHVVAIFDTIKEGGKIVAIVEEHVDGEMLDALFSRGLGLPDKLKLLYQLACGIHDMHVVGCVHRDLKPNNIKIRPDGLLKILDLGISTILRDGDETLIGKGTHGYKAPEFYHTAPIKVTAKCDAYSFGVIAHQLLSDGSLAAGFQRVPPNPMGAGVSFEALIGGGKKLTRILDACLASKPEARPEASEIRDAIASEIVRGRHRAILVSGGQQYIVDSENSAVKVGDAGNEITVEYTGTRFAIRALAGDVYVNNRAMKQGEKLTGAMVFTLGAPAMGSGRTFITFDISHPEILV